MSSVAGFRAWARRWWWLGALLLVLPGCGSSKSSPQSGTPGAAGGSSQVLRLGYFPNITHATAIAGVEQGIFAESLGPSVKLQTNTFTAGPAAVEAIFSGALDASYVGPNPAINAFVRSHGEAVRVIAGAASGGAFFVVKPEINAAQDLRGKRVASPQLGNTQDVALRSWLRSQGLNADAQGGGDVSIVPQDNAQTLNAFRAGQIAGAWVPEPWATRLIVDGGGKVLVDERDLWPEGQYATTVLVVRTAYLQQHADVVQRLLKGHIAATTYVQQHPAEAQQTVNNALERLTGSRLPDAVIQKAWGNLNFTNDPVASSLTKSARDAESLGFLQLGGADLRRLYALEPLNQILRASGATEVHGP